MKQTVLCELCNKSYAIGVMRRHRHTKMPIENAKNHGVKKQKRPIRKQKRPTKMHVENAKNRGVPSWWFVGGHKPNT